MLRVGARSAVAEHHELAAAVEAACHRVTRSRDVLGVVGEVDQWLGPAVPESVEDGHTVGP
jgi:hypothetical protein